jgi:hypothetical protein
MRRAEAAYLDIAKKYPESLLVHNAIKADADLSPESDPRNRKSQVAK